MSMVNFDVYRSTQSPVSSIAKATQPVVVQFSTLPPEMAVTQPSKQELVLAVAHLNRYIASAVSSIEFSVDDDSGKTVVKVVDSETRKVLRQIPNAEALSLSKSLDRVEGLIIKQKV